MNLTLSQVPEYFSKKKEEGDARKGLYYFITADLDDVYGEVANLEVSWDETNPVRYHVGKESSLLANDMLVGVGITDKKVLNVHGHDAYYLVGAKKEVRKSRVYMTTSVLANWCCPQTKRKFVVKASVHRENFPGMEEHIITIIMGVLCH
nr:hypothetical protein [Candidatus Sigynarchaeum springense]